MKSNRFYIYLAISVAILAGLIVRDYNPAGRLEISTDFSKPTPYISTLNPPGNVNKGYVAQMPVTFKVHLPNYYNRVEVFAKTDQLDGDLQVGLVTSPDPEMVKLEQGTVLNLPQQTELKFQLDYAQSAEAKPFTIKELRLVFSRDHQNFIDYLSIWKKSIKSIF